MARGQRDPKREEFWRGVLRRYADGGLSARAFCRREQLGEASFYAWRRTIRERDGATSTEATITTGPRRGTAGSTSDPQSRRSAPPFVPLVPTLESRSDVDRGIRIELRGGRVIHLPESIEADRLVALVRALEAEATR